MDRPYYIIVNFTISPAAVPEQRPDAKDRTLYPGPVGYYMTDFKHNNIDRKNKFTTYEEAEAFIPTLATIPGLMFHRFSIIPVYDPFLTE